KPGCTKIFQQDGTVAAPAIAQVRPAATGLRTPIWLRCNRLIPSSIARRDDRIGSQVPEQRGPTGGPRAFRQKLRMRAEINGRLDWPEAQGPFARTELLDLDRERASCGNPIHQEGLHHAPSAPPMRPAKRLPREKLI